MRSDPARDPESGAPGSPRWPPRRRAGLSLTAPLHALLVHFTVALTSAAFVFDLLAFVFGFDEIQSTGWWLLAAAVVATPAVLASGLRSRLRLAVEEGPMRAFLRTHMAVGPLLFGLLIVLAIWRAQLWERGSGVTGWYLAALAGVVGVMALQGYLGGELVYRYGAEVRGHYRRLAERPGAPGVRRPGLPAAQPPRRASAHPQGLAAAHPPSEP